jgi:HNH endonuclease
MNYSQVIDFEEWLTRNLDVGDCWLWKGYKNKRGYGRVLRKTWGETLVYRAIWIRLVGPIPPGMTLDHLCRVPSCVNPDHLEPVPMRVNRERGAADWTTGRCKRNHPASSRVRTASGQTFCRDCHRESDRRTRERGRLELSLTGGQA